MSDEDEKWIIACLKDDSEEEFGGGRKDEVKKRNERRRKWKIVDPSQVISHGITAAASS